MGRHASPLALLLAGCSRGPKEAGAPGPADTVEVSPSCDQTDFLLFRDDWPNDVSTSSHRVITAEDADAWSAVDAVLDDDGAVQVLLMFGGEAWMAPLDLESGTLDTAAAALLLGASEEGPDSMGLANASIARCRPVPAQDQPLTWDAAAGLWRLPALGVDLGSVRVHPAGPGCAPQARALSPGLRHRDGRRSADGLRLHGAEACPETLRVDYEASTCSLEGDAAWACPVGGSGDLGACAWFMVYEAQERGASSGAVSDRVMMLAHAAALTGPWVKHIPSGASAPTDEDVLLRSTAPHSTGTSSEAVRSFVSAPDLWWDPVAGLWRLWVVAEVLEGSASRSTESADDGLSWGIGRQGRPIDCWDQEASDWDSGACEAVTWDADATPPDDPATTRSPEVVDMSVVTFPGEPAESAHVMAIFAGANTACAPDPRWTGYLLGEHLSGGAGGAGWRWCSAVPADPTGGVAVAADRDDPSCTVELHDFTVLQVEEGKGLLLFQPIDPGSGFQGVMLVGSGFACSNAVDDDGDGQVDYGADPDCLSPTDDAE